MLNGGFESINHDELPENWNFYTKRKGAVRVDTIHHTGRFGLRMSCKQETNAMGQETVIESTDFRQGYVTAFMRTDSMNGKVGLVAVVYNNKKLRYAYGSEGSEVTHNMPWSLIRIPLILEAGANKVTVGCQMSGTGVVWLDDFRVDIREPVTVPSSKTVQRYVKQFLKYIDKEALYRDSIDFAKFQSTVRGFTSNLGTREESYPILNYAVTLLNDEHSRFFGPKWMSGYSAQSSNGQGFVYPSGKMIDGVAHVVVPAFGSMDKLAGRDYADSLQRIIEGLDRAKPEGWIIDVSANSGGNCWPMIAGLGPLIGKDTIGFFFAKGKFGDPWNYQRGESRIGKSVMCTVKRAYALRETKPKIVVLQGKRTASSGEIVAIAFRGMAGAISMGDRTRGLTTGTTPLRMPDGATLLLATSCYADRNRNVFGSVLIPDKLLRPDEDPIAKAVEWLKSH